MRIFEIEKQMRNLDEEMDILKLEIHQFLYDNDAFDLIFYRNKSLVYYGVKRDTMLNSFKFGNLFEERICPTEDGEIEFSLIEYDENDQYYDSMSFYLTVGQVTNPIALKKFLTLRLEKQVENGTVPRSAYRELRLNQLLD